MVEKANNDDIDLDDQDDDKTAFAAAASIPVGILAGLLTSFPVTAPAAAATMILFLGKMAVGTITFGFSTATMRGVFRIVDFFSSDDTGAENDENKQLADAKEVLFTLRQLLDSVRSTQGDNNLAIMLAHTYFEATRAIPSASNVIIEECDDDANDNQQKPHQP